MQKRQLEYSRLIAIILFLLPLINNGLFRISQNAHAARREDQFRKWPTLTLWDHLFGNKTRQLIERYPYFVNSTTGKLTLVRDYIKPLDVYKPGKEYLSQSTIESQLYDLEKNVDFESRFRRDHSYSNEQDLIESGYPVSNQTVCHKHLKWLRYQLIDNKSHLFDRGEPSMRLMHYLDSFGRPEHDTYSGNVYWLGSFEKCQSIKFHLNSYEYPVNNASIGDSMRTRYCFAKMRVKTWPQDDNFSPKVSIKVGICLPESCDSSSIVNESSIIEQLMSINFAQIYYDRLKLIDDDMYCLPDERSPVRKFKPATKIFLLLNALWLSAVLVATVSLELIKSRQKRATSDRYDKYNYQKISNVKEEKIVHNSQSLSAYNSSTSQGQEPDQITTILKKEGTTNGTKQDQFMICDTSPDDRKQTQLKKKSIISDSKLMTMLKMLSAVENYNSLVTVKKKRNINDKSGNKQQVCIGGDDNKDNRPPPKRINLNPLKSLKVMATLIIVHAHIVYYSGITFRSSRNFNHYYLEDPIVVMDTSSALLVETFFIIGGILMGYMSMKQLTMTRKPLITLVNFQNWVMLSLIKLARLLPMFILVFCYGKLVAVYTASGPLWDYGTNMDSMRGRCINSEWFRMWIFFSNSGLNSYPPCNEPSWFLPVYMHIVLVSPLILYLFARFPRINIGILAIMSLVSGLYEFQSFYTQTDYYIEMYMQFFWPANFVQEKYSSRAYTNAFARVATVASGILAGYYLERYESGKLKEWPWWMRGLVFKLIIFILCLVLISPIGSFLFRYELLSMFNPKTKFSQFTSVFIHCLNLRLFSIANIIIILRITTDETNRSVVRLLSQQWWEIFNKLTYCIYLIHYEIIIYIYTAYDEHLSISWYKICTDTLVAITTSVPLSFFLYILYESPFSSLLGLCFRK